MAAAPEDAIEYTEDFIARLELMWGEGFLSPGGPEEIAELIAGCDVAGCSVLDLGCGLGGMAVILARDYGAARVTGIDVEQPLLDRAADLAARSGLGDRLTFRRIASGPLPFADAAFDVVTSKDAIIHIPNKAAIYAELYRVLAPGGRLVVSDWLGGERPFSPEMEAWLATANSEFEMATLAATVRAVEGAGFVDVEARDRNAWYRAYARREVAELAGAKRVRLTELLGAAEAAAWIARMDKKARAVAAGDLRPAHIRARKLR